MKATKHTLTAINTVSFTAECAKCGTVKIRPNGTYASGEIKWRCCKGGGREYGDYIKGDTCESCGIKPRHARALDVHHINGDSDDNTNGNHVTLCGTCHQELEGDLDLVISGRADAETVSYFIKAQNKGLISVDYLDRAKKANR